MVDVMKRRERERVMTEVIEQIQAEKEALVAAASTQRVQNQELPRTVEEILVDNQRKIEVHHLLPLYRLIELLKGNEAKGVH
jgi:hypothetical protein